ncbi:MAG: FecR domain-containing protein [Polaromonas sp.]|nr:FecR domain-containing protein [Polaromonas sp.]
MFFKSLLVIACIAGCAAANSATIFALQGRVEVERGSLRLPAVKGVALKQGDVVRTFENGELVIVFDDGSVASMRNNSELKLDAYRLRGNPEERNKVINLAVGTLRYVSAVFSRGAKMDTSLRTTTATIGIRGTDFELSYFRAGRNDTDATGTYVKVNSGLVAVTGKDGSEVEVGSAQTAFAGEPALAPMGGGTVAGKSTKLTTENSTKVFNSGGSLDALLTRPVR